MLQLQAVSKRYGTGGWVLNDVHLEVPPGEIVAISGHNGSGKSTLLRVLVGLSKPTSGKVLGRPDAVGYVPDRFPPNERLSAVAYLTHMGRIRGLSTPAATRRAGELLDRLSLVGGKRTPLRALSKGNAQKVVLAQALLVPPHLLVLDEPWSGLDASAHGVLSEILTEVAEAGGTVVFTDHRESITRAHAGRTYAIADGRVSLRSVEAAEHRSAVVEVVLTLPHSKQLSLSVSDLYGMDGVLDAVAHGNQVTVQVTANSSDALLLAALTQGWSVRSAAVVRETTS